MISTPTVLILPPKSPATVDLNEIVRFYKIPRLLKILPLTLVVFLFNTCFISSAMNASDLPTLLPQNINGWAISDTDRYYNNETLYNYIDGAAELYLSYGFDTVISRRFSCKNEPDIVVEIFNMLEPRNAFGVFTNMREKNDREFGQGSQQIEGSLIFWKHQYFISIIADRKTDKSTQTIKQIAGYIDNAIKKRGDIPEIISLLPSEGLVPEGFCYFHHYIWLNAFYFISNNNILNIDNTVNAVLAKYGPADKRMYLLLAQYKNSATAVEAFKKFTSEYAPELTKNPFVKIEDKTWLTARINVNYIIILFNINQKKEAEMLISKINTNNHEQ